MNEIYRGRLDRLNIKDKTYNNFKVMISSAEYTGTVVADNLLLLIIMKRKKPNSSK